MTVLSTVSRRGMLGVAASLAAAPALAAATRLIPATPVAQPQPAYDEHGVAEPDAEPVDNTALGSLPPATAATICRDDNIAGRQGKL